MDFAKITNEYYSKWLGVTPERMYANGVIFVESPERDRKQIGYSSVFNVYAYVTNNLIITSYSKRVSDKIEILKNEINVGMTAKEVSNIIGAVFNTQAESHIKFCYEKNISNIDTSNVVKLVVDDYPKFLKFFMTQNPDVEEYDWVEDYFNDISRCGMVFGVFENDKVTSVTEAPDMPYMNDTVQEIGINTLPKYRGKGYAKLVTLKCINSIIDSGKCPQWSCNANNIASEKLAYSVGFRKLADVILVADVS